MVFDDIEQVKVKLKSIEKIGFSKHAEEKIKTRNIEKEFIVKNLKNPDKLLKFSYEPDKYPGEKYELYFSISKRKSLKAVVSFTNEGLNVITSHIISGKRTRLVEKWQRKRR